MAVSVRVLTSDLCHHSPLSKTTHLHRSQGSHRTQNGAGPTANHMNPRSAFSWVRKSVTASAALSHLAHLVHLCMSGCKTFLRASCCGARPSLDATAIARGSFLKLTAPETMRPNKDEEPTNGIRDASFRKGTLCTQELAFGG